MEHQPKHKILPAVPEATSYLSFFPINIPKNEEFDL